MFLRQKCILLNALKYIWSQCVQIYPVIILLCEKKKVIGQSAEKARKDNYFMFRSVTSK